ncbi:hypothetical protein BH10PLA2_BH10PLA2_18870 [soil metagenome]
MRKPETVVLEEACPTRDQLTALLSDELTGDITARLEDHVAACPACQATLLDLGGQLDLGKTPASAIVTITGNTTIGEEPRADFLKRLVVLAVEEATKSPGVEHVALETFEPELPGIDILDELGRGALGIVYLARQKQINRLVALKVVAVDRFANDKERERARRGVEAVTHLQHPNIIQIFHVGRHDRWFYGTLEYMEGGSLRDRLTGAPLAPKEAAELLHTLALAAAFVHEKGFVHRDLKPANILFKANGTPKLADFGLARSFAESSNVTLEGETLGTPSYMAPEQARGKQDIGPGADIYALGAILYELLTGKPPFRGVTKLDTLYQVVHLPPVPVSRLQPAVPVDLATICMRCLEKEPELRYATANALASDLERFLTARAIRPSSFRWLQRFRTRLSNHPALTLFVGLLLLVGLLEFIAMGSLWLETTQHDRSRQNQANYSQINQLASQVMQAQNDLASTLPDLAEYEMKAGNKARARELLNKVPAQLRDDHWQKLMNQSSPPSAEKSTPDKAMGGP